jgi:hypothetical protein
MQRALIMVWQNIKVRKPRRKPEGMNNVLLKDLHLINFFNAMTIFESDLKVLTTARSQPTRLQSVIEALQENKEIEDIPVKSKSKSEPDEYTRVMKAFVFIIIKRGFMKRLENETIAKLEKYGPIYKTNCQDKGAVRDYLEKDTGFNENMTNIPVKYYYGKIIGDHIQKHRHSYGLNTNRTALLFFLIGIADYDFNEWINKEIDDMLETFYIMLDRQLEDIIRYAEKYGVPLPQENEKQDNKDNESDENNN